MGKNKKKPKECQDIEFRYYEILPEMNVLALLGERWILHYGSEAMHFHNYLEIGYCYYGEGRMILDGREEEYQGQMFTVIPRSCPHCTRSREGTVSRWEYLFVDVEGFLKKQYKDRPVVMEKMLARMGTQPELLPAVRYPAMTAAIHALLEELREKKSFYKESVQGYLMTLLVELTRIRTETEGLEQSGSENRIAGVLRYVSEHFSEEITISRLAEICHVSETHFRRLFEKTMNVSPTEYVNMVRIQNACALMKETSESIESIRERVGFPTASTFNRNFRKLLGMAPAQWRSQQSGKMADYRISIYKGW